MVDPTEGGVPVDTVVLDIDGTLLDSNYHHTLAWSRAIAAYADRHAPAAVIHRGDRDGR